MTNSTEHKLMSEFQFAIDILKHKGFVSSYFKQMLDKYGSIKTAKKLINSDQPKEGLEKLIKLGLEKYSMESIVLKEDFSDSFTTRELEICKKRLGLD